MQLSPLAPLRRARAALQQARRKAGQAAVLIALMLFSAVIFLALATNMGMLANDRIRLQSAADLGAYAAAYNEAQQLNELVYLNNEILDIAGECRDFLASLIWPGDICICQAKSTPAELYIETCRIRLEIAALRFQMAALYSNSVQPGVDAGEATMDQNMSGLTGAGSKIVSSADLRLFRADTIPWTIANYDRVQDTKFNYMVLLMCPSPTGCIPAGTLPSQKTHELATWFVKDDKDPDIWVMALAQGTPQNTYLDIAYGSGGDGGYFGASSTGGTDKMYALAVAKPYEGSVGPSEVSGNQRNGNTLFGLIYTSQGLTYPEMAMLETYRARIAGLNEWSSGSADPIPTEGFIWGGGDWMKWSMYASRFQH